MTIADIGRRHLSDALAGNLAHCVVSEWLDPDSGAPVKVYWKPLTGTQQKRIDAFTDYVTRTCATVKFRALDADGKLIFANVPVESLLNDFDYSVIRAIAYLMATQLPDDIGESIEELEKE